MNPADAARIMRGHAKAVAAAQDRARMVAYELARWVAFSFHDPKHAPAFEPLSGDKAAAATAAEKAALVNDARVRGYLIRMSKRVH